MKQQRYESQKKNKANTKNNRPGDCSDRIKRSKIDTIHNHMITGKRKIKAWVWIRFAAPLTKCSVGIRQEKK
ncbi:hypothetical protein HMF3257_04395 [Spirosoma telluris]|uniref:Uncharacterized protein n=1 Tax=Spirosoma telluris TaxID=2183553 RepID=A0A327NEV9_9BACT|nr:hypothetical protein HMF3257_04395 [Spirosoma telluris]